MSFLKNNWHWMLFTLVIFGGIGVAVWTQLQTDAEPKTVYKPPSAETLQNIREKAAARKAQATDGTQRPPPPGETHETGHWHGDHWHRTAPAGAQQSEGEYGVTRQGKQYIKNSAHADVPAANATPTGPPLNIDWQDGGHPPPGSVINWRDPRTWESYRNFWGFEPPDENPQTGREYTPTLDNWGTPLQHFRGTFIITHYKKRIGFRPSPEQLAEYKQLQAQLETARVNGETLRADNLQRDIRSLMNSARGELPIRHTYHSVGYGPAGVFDDPEKKKAAREAAERDLYKRMGIEHLYEFYEKEQ